MKQPASKKRSDTKNKGGRPNDADSIIRSMNDYVYEKLEGEILQDRIVELVDVYKLKLDDLSDRTHNICNKGYLSMLYHGKHLADPPKCRPRQIHLYAIGLVYTNVKIDSEGSREETEAAHELNDSLLKVLPKLKRYMKAKATR